MSMPISEMQPPLECNTATSEQHTATLHSSLGQKVITTQDVWFVQDTFVFAISVIGIFHHSFSGPGFMSQWEAGFNVKRNNLQVVTS